MVVKRKRFIGRLLSLFFLCVMIPDFSGWAFADRPVRKETVPETAGITDRVTKVHVQKTYGKIPLYFIQNNGQMDEITKFYETGSGHSTFFTKDGVYLSLIRHEDVRVESQRQGSIPQAENSKTLNFQLIKLSFLNASKDPEIVAEGLQKGKINYFIGKSPDQWRRNISTYRAVRYKDVYKGIDIRFYGNNHQLDYDIIIKPGADLSKIRFSYEGIEGLKITDGGNLEVGLKGGKLIQKMPYIYQEIGGKRVKVDGKFKVSEKRSTGNDDKRFSYGFEVASYNKSYPLIIDPVLIYSTYFGGSDFDSSRSIAVDNDGNAYITGYTYSPDFPTLNPIQATHGDGGVYWDVFVAKIDTSGSSIVYSTYIGGSNNDLGWGITVDEAGSAYVVGYTESSDFPVASPIQGSNAGGADIFLIKIDSTGSSLSYATYLGGSGNDWGYTVAVDSAGAAYIIGKSESTDFPMVNPIYGSNAGNYDAVIAKIDVTGTAIVYSTYLGGYKYDLGRSIAVNSIGEAYITGWTYSPDFPMLNPIQASKNGRGDAFVAKIDSAGASLIYSTYLGGNDRDSSKSIAIDGYGNAYIAGWTYSTDFPTQNPIQGSFGGVRDVFVAKIDSAGASLIYSTYLGGSDVDGSWAIATDSAGDAYVTGWTYSSDFPTQNPLQGDQGGEDVFVTKIDATGSSLSYSTYLGGSISDFGGGIAVDSVGNAYITGWTYSPDFPILNSTPGGYIGTSNVFVTKIGETAWFSGIIAGQGSESVSEVTDIDGCGSTVNAAFTTFGSSANPDGTVRVAKGDVTGDGVPEIVVGTYGGTLSTPANSLVKVFSQTGTLITTLKTFNSADNPTGNIDVGLGDLDMDGINEIIVGGGEGSGSIVKIFDDETSGYGLLKVFETFDLSMNPSGAVYVDGGYTDVTGTKSTGQIVVGSGSNNSFISVYDYATPPALVNTFTAFYKILNPSGRVDVSVGDINGDSVDEIVVGAGDGGDSRVRVFDEMGIMLDDFVSFGSVLNPLGLVNVSTGDVDGDGVKEIIVGTGGDVVTPGVGKVREFDIGGGPFICEFDVFDSGSNPSGYIDVGGVKSRLQ